MLLTYSRPHLMRSAILIGLGSLSALAYQNSANRVLMYGLCAVFLLFVLENLLFNIDDSKNLHQWLNEHLYDEIFDESAFIPLYNENRYNSIVRVGYRTMAETDLIFGGLCKNSIKVLPLFKKRIERLATYFKSFKLVVFENDSTDGTREFLEEWVSACPDLIQLVECPNNCKLGLNDAITSGPFSSGRMTKMAYFRNRLLECVRNIDQREQNKYSTLCIADIDIQGPTSIDGIAHSFGLKSTKLYDWDCISAYGLTAFTLIGNKLVYYDSLALKLHEDSDLSNTYAKCVLNSTLVSFKSRGSEPIPVVSAFCGLALYTMESIRSGVQYREVNPKGTCEHILFNEDIARQGFKQHYINPNMILLAGLQGKKSDFTH